MIRCTKGVLLAFFLIISAKSLLAQELSFGYDAAGNQVNRTWICVNCGTFPQVLSTPVEEPGINKVSIAEPPKTILNKLTVYPNPFTETLFVKWQSDQNISIKSIDVYTMGGNRVFHKEYSPEISEMSMEFGGLAAGFYLVTIRYSNKKTETVKVVKRD